MIKPESGFWRTIAFSAFLLVSLSAFATDPVSTSQVTEALFPLEMPRFEQWKDLSSDAQKQVIEALQEYLVQSDKSVRKAQDPDRGHGHEHALNWLFEQWLKSAEAQTSGTPFCINQGVIKPIENCDKSHSRRMNDFDTSEMLSKLGPASECSSGERPCSPAFGFNSSGQMFCSAKNLTQDCARKSKEPGAIPLAHVLVSCAAGSPGAAKVDCKALSAFFNEQMDTVEKLCRNYPRSHPCRVLRAQVHMVFIAAVENGIPADNFTMDQVKDAVATTNEVVKMSANLTPCPPHQTACSQKDLSTGAHDYTVKGLYSAMIGQDEDGFQCGELLLPDQRKITFQPNQKDSLQFQSSPNSKPLSFDIPDLVVLNAASQTMLKAPLNVAPGNLLASYFPKEELKSPGKLAVKVGPDKTVEFQTKGWVSANGTRIRYIPDTHFGKDKPMWIAAVQLPGTWGNLGIGKEVIIRVPVPPTTEPTAHAP